MIPCYTRDNLSFILIQALHVEIEMKNLNLQVTSLVQKGAGTHSHTKIRCGNAVPTPLLPWYSMVETVSRSIFASLGLEDFKSRDFEYCKEIVY